MELSGLMQMKDVNETESVIGQNSAVRVGLVVVLLGVAWWGATLTADVNTIKNSMVRLNAIDTIAARMDTLSSRMDSLEKRGSDPVQALQKSVDKIAQELQLHCLTDQQPKGKQP